MLLTLRFLSLADAVSIQKLASDRQIADTTITIFPVLLVLN